MEVLSKDMPGYEENYEKPHPGYQMYWQRFELGIAEMQVKGVIAELTFSLPPSEHQTSQFFCCDSEMN
jgi:hypothetical protein